MDGGSHFFCDGHFIHASVNLRWSWMLWALVGFCGVRSAAVQTDAVQTDTLHVWVHDSNAPPKLQPCDSVGTGPWFTVKEDAWEAPICVSLTDDASEMEGTYVDLHVWVSRGMVRCDGVAGAESRPNLFTTQCAGVSSRPAAIVKESCELHTDGKLRASLREARSCLENLVYTPPSNFNGEVQMRIAVSDNGFTGSLQASAGEIRTTTELGTIQVDAVNDMPYLTWITLPPKEMLNNESFPFQGLRIHDPDVVGWRAERTDTFTLTFDTLGGEILFPLGEPLLREQVPAPPHRSKYVRLQGNLSAVQESCARFIYKPPPGFVGEDIVTVRVSDGGLGGAGNLTGELGFRVKVSQALVPVDLVVESAKLTTQEDELLRFGRESRTQIKFPSRSSDLFLKIFSTDGALVHPAATMSIIPGGPNNLRYLNISSTSLEVSGTLAGLNILLDEVHFRHPTRDWFNVPARPARISLQACQFDMLLDRTTPGTCSTKYIEIDIKPVDDAPSVLSLEHPWALPLETLEDTAMQLCCFTIFDPDVRSAGATASFSGAPWLFRMRIMARFGNISVAQSVGNIVLTEQEYNLIGFEGYAADLEPLLDSIVYTPAENMNSNHAVDHLCFFLTDSPGSKRIGNVREFTGCWDILIQPVNDPPTLTQMFDGTSLEPTCDSLELVNESFENLTGNLTCASGIRFRLESHGGENAMIPLPSVRIEDVDCEEVASDQPPLSVFVRAELGSILQPAPCPGLQIRQVGTQLYGFWWEMMGSVSALNRCLASGLMYQPPASTYHGNDAVLVEASDLGHHGLLTETAAGTVRLKMMLHVHRVEEPLTLEASPQLLPQAMEDVLVDIRSFTLRYSQLQADVMVRLELTSSCGRLFLSTSLDWRREKAIVMETPISGESLRWRGRAKDVDAMLQNVTYSSDLPGLSCIYGTLSVEQNPETGIYDLVLRQMLQIPIIGVNDAPQVSGPDDWSIQAGTAISLAAMGIRLEDPDAAEGLSDIWRLPRVGLPETAGPEDLLLSGSDLLSVIVRVRTSPGLLTVTDWTGIDPTQELQFQACGVEAAASGQGCSALELRVRPDLLPQVADRLLLSMPVDQAAAQGDLEVHLDDRGLSGRGEPLSDMWRVKLRVSPTDLPPSFLVHGLQDGPGESMFHADHNRTRPGLEDPVTRAGGLGVQLIPADQNEGRIYECNVSVPYGGEVELAQYNNKFLPEEAIADVQHRFGAGLRTFLALRATLRNLNVALQVIRFKPFPGFTGSAFLRVTSKLVDSMHANVTEVPIYVEPPVTCNAYMKIADELEINGTDVRKVGEYMLIYAMASGYQESKSAAYINALLVQTVDTLRQRPQEDCDSVTVEVVLGPLHATAAGGRGYLFLNGSAADNDCVLADTHRAGGAAVFLHGKLSEINATLPHLCYRWLSDAGQEEPFGTEARVSLYIRAYLSADDPRDLILGTMDLVVLPSEAEEPMEMVNVTMPVSPALQLVATKSSAAGAVEVLQGANMTLSTVLQLEADESTHPWPVELDSPTYFELNLSLADGLTFAMPLPVHCTTAELVSRANANEQVIQQDVSIFSASLAPRTRLNLHASFATMQTCLDQLEVHIPWDTPVTAPALSTGPYLMSTVPANGSTEVSTSDFQVLLTFNDWVQAGEGYFHIVDCGADNLCGAVGNMDDRVIDISVHDAFSVSFNKHLVLIKHSERLRGLNLHQFVIPPGAIRDISGVDFPGVLAKDFTFRTGLASSTPLGWRLTSGNISDEVGQPGGWYVCELQFFLSSDCTTDLMQGTPASSSEANTSTWQEFSEFEANLAFDQSTGTCWWSDSNVPGSWIGLHVKSPGLYARSLRLQGKVGEVKPDEIYVQFYVGGMWYTLQSFGYTEECVSLSSDLSMIFGNEFDTVAPRMVSSVPALSSSLAVSTTQRISLVFSERIQIVPGSEVRLVDAGDDGLCSTADDTVLSIPVELPTAYAQNGTVPWVYITGTTVLVRFPDQDMTAGNYHCLQVEPGIIQDLAATPFPGLVGDDFRFLVAATPFQDATEPILVATEPPSGTDLQGLQIHSFKLFMSELVVPVDADLMVRSAQIAGPHEIYFTTLHTNGSLDMNTDHIVIPFTAESDVTTPMHLSISDSVLSVTLNKTLLIGKTYTIWIEPNSFTDQSTTFIFDVTGVPTNIPRNFAGLAPGDVVFTVVEPTDLERNPYKKSTIPVWDVEVEEIARPEKEPLMPLHLDHCYIDFPNCTERNETNGSNTSNCTNFENVSVLSICSLTPRSGMGFAEVREREMWLQPWHWLRATTHNATFEVQLDVRDANSPVLIKSRDEDVHVLAGMPQLLATSQNEGPFVLQDDSFGELFVEVSVEPAGTLGILRSAWRDWGGRVNVTFDFPPVKPDYGSLGQGDLTPTTLEGRPASKLSFYGMAVSVEAALGNLSYTAPEEFEGAALMKVLIRDGEFVREEGIVINVQLPPTSLQVISQATASVAATASTEHDLNSLGCGWNVEDGAGAMSPEVVYHLTTFVVDPLACAAVLFEDCASRPVQGGLGGSCAPDMPEHSAEQVESWESTERGYKILHLRTPSFKLLRHHLQHSLIFHPCGCPVNSRFECSQTIYVAVERRNQQAPEVVEVAESSCLMTVSAPLSMFVALRGSSLAVDEDGVLPLAERFYIEGKSPSPFHFTASAELGNISAEGTAGMQVNGSKSFLEVRMDSVQDLLQLLDVRQVSYVPVPEFWGEDMIYFRFETTMSPSVVSDVDTTTHESSWLVEVRPQPDLPKIDVYNGVEERAMANQPHHVNASIRHVDLGAEDHARVYVESPFGDLSFPALDTIMDEISPGLTEFFTNNDFDAPSEAEARPNVQARDGVWPSISMYESSVGDGYTIAGTLASVNRVLSMMQFTPPADSPSSGSLSITVHQTPSSAELEVHDPDMLQMNAALAEKHLNVEIEPLTKSEYPCFIGGPAATFVNPGEDARNLGVTVRPEFSASTKVANEVAETLYEFRVSVRFGLIGLDVNKYPAARICPPFYPDVGGCKQDEVDAWVIYGTIEQAALTMESIVYTPPVGYAGQDLMRVTGSCSEVTLEVALNIVKGFSPPRIRCCDGVVLEVERALEPSAVPPCHMERNEYGEIPAVAQVMLSTDIGQLAFWPVAGLYFDHSLDVMPMHNVSSQIVASGPGTTLQQGLATKLALLFVPETETRTAGQLTVEVLDARSGLKSTSTCPIHVSTERKESLPQLQLDMPTPNATYLLSGRLGARRQDALLGLEVDVPSVGLIAVVPRAACLVLLHVAVGELDPPLLPPRRLAVQWSRRGSDRGASYRLLAESAEDAAAVLGRMRYMISEAELEHLPMVVPIEIAVYALPTLQLKDEDAGILRDQRVLQLEIDCEPSVPIMRVRSKELEVQRGNRLSFQMLGAELHYPRRMVLQLLCNSCVFFNNELQWHGVHQVAGSAPFLQKYVEGLQLEVRCSSCDADQIILKAWDPDALGRVGEETKTAEGNLIVQVSTQVLVQTSRLAQAEPLLRVLSAGVLAKAGEATELVDYISLQSADPNEPLGLAAVQSDVEVRLSALHGILEIDVANLVGGSAFLADAKGGAASATAEDQDVWASVGARMNITAFRNPAPDDQSRLPYVDPSRPTDPWNLNLSETEGPIRPDRVQWSGRSLLLRGAAQQMKQTLKQLKYTPDEFAAGWDTVLVRMGMQTGEIPVYSLRQVGDVVLKATPLKTLTVGEVLRLNVTAELNHLVQDDDVFSALVTCGHGGFALWSFAGRMEVLGSSLEFSGNTSELQDFLANVTYVHADGFTGMDRLQIFVQGRPIQAANREAPAAETSIAVVVQLTETILPPASVEMPERLNVFEDSVTPPRIKVHDLRPVAPSGVALASATTATDLDRTCLRAAEPDTWITQTLSSVPCDLFLVVGSNGTSVDQLECAGCTLRAAHLPDECLTWVTGPVAEVAGLSGGWALAACQNNTVPEFASQSFEFSTMVEAEGGRFCVEALNSLEGCFDILTMTVNSQIYRGLPTVTTLVEGVEPPDCSGSWEVMNLSLSEIFGENISEDLENLSLPLAKDRCEGDLSCEFLFQPVELLDPAPGCNKEVIVSYTCPNHLTYESRARLTPNQTTPASVMIQCPVVFLPSPDPVALRGSLQVGSFSLKGVNTMWRLRQLTACPEQHEPSRSPLRLLRNMSLPSPGAASIELLPEVVLFFSEDVFIGRGKALLREVEKLAGGANDDQLREFTLHLSAMANRASYQVTTPLLPLTVYEVVLEPGAVEDTDGWAFAGFQDKTYTFSTGLFPVPVIAPLASTSLTEESLDTMTVSSRRKGISSFAKLVDGERVSQFCVMGAPVALAEFAEALRYSSALHWSGNEPMRITIAAAYDSRVVHSAAESWILVQPTNDLPHITADEVSFQVQVGRSVAITGINISDPDAGDQTRWMTLLVAASTGRLYLEPSFKVEPNGTLEPLKGRLDGDFALRVQGSGPDLQAFVDALRFSTEAPAKPYLEPLPLDQPRTEAIVSYILSDTIGPQAGALRWHQVAGKVVNPETSAPIEDVDVVLIARDKWHDYEGYDALAGCDAEITGLSVEECKTHAVTNSYIAFSYGLYQAGGSKACCFKTADAETILTNLVADANVDVYVFQPGGYSVHTKTTELGIYAAIMPTAPADIYFAKTLHATRSLSVDVQDNIQVGGLADIYLQALAVVTIWRFEVDWKSSTPVDLDAHAFDAWDCHTYFANRQCQHDGSHGLTVTLNRDNRDVLHGREVITVHQWPCDSDQATIGGYRDVWSCLAHFWVQIFSDHGFSDVEGTVSVFRGGVLIQEVQLPAAKQPDSFWIGFVLDWSSSTVDSFYNQAGGAEVVENFLGGIYELPPARDVRRLRLKENVTSAAKRRGPLWRERLRQDLLAEKESLEAGSTTQKPPLHYHLQERRLSSDEVDAGNVADVEEEKAASPSRRVAVIGDCGDGIITSDEECDDGNSNDTDGCSNCTVDDGFYCRGEPSECSVHNCSDGFITSDEECDDENVDDFDGCTSGCKVETGYYCSGEPSVCATRCGDGRRIIPHEQCDDENALSGDGCSATCQIEAGYVCEGGTEMIRDHCYPKCGDGVRVPHESCDDGNTQDGDGCSSRCRIELGYACHGGNTTHVDTCRLTVCGDGVVEGAEECDDFNDYGGDGCSAVCLWEIKEVASWSQTEVMVTIRPLGQLCRIYNARKHQTFEDTTYHLQNTILTGDVSEPDSVRIHVEVVDGSIAIRPLVELYLEKGRNDSVWEAIVQRETGVRFYPYSNNMKDTIISGTYFEVDRFLRHYLYIAPDPDFSGYVQVLFAVTSGMVLNHGAEECKYSTVIQVVAVYDDPASVIVPEEVQTNGFHCLAGSPSCSLGGISLYDPDCEMAVDGSCYLRLELNVTAGQLSIPGHPDGWQEVFPGMMGHAAGLNAALDRLVFFPPSLREEDSIFHVTVNRVIARTIATPPSLLPASTSLALSIKIQPADTPPTVGLASGQPFHGALFVVEGSKPYQFTNIVFEPPGASSTTCVVELRVSRGILFLGDTEGLWFADGTNNGESRLRFVGDSSDIRNRFLADVRYAWDDNDCSNLEQFNISVDSGEHQALTLISMLVLPSCQGYEVEWLGGALTLEEDSEISIGHLAVSTKDLDLFLVVDVKHPPDVAGDCKVVRWPEAVPSFMPGRECHLDGLIGDLSDTLQHLVYKPPPDFVGHIQLQFVIYRAEVKDEILGVESSRGMPITISVDIEVTGVNDAPALELDLDSYTFEEDMDDYVSLGPMFVSDSDAGQNLMSFRFELVLGHEWNRLMMCGLVGVEIEEPWENMLDEAGCLDMGTSLIHFNTTVENFNSMQTGPGRLQFKPAPDWHGSAMINITVDDKGSAHGEQHRLTVQRSLYIVVEPMIDKPKLSILCPEALPFLGYGRTCLEVRECFALNASLDTHDTGLSFWMVIEASDPGVGISLEDRAPVQVWREGTSTVQVSGLYHNVQQALRALIFRPPVHLFAAPDDPDVFEFNVSIQAFAIGERFNEPLPLDPGLIHARPGLHHGKPYPSDSIDFPVVIRRVNRAPLIFVDVDHYSATQMQDDVNLYGVSVIDPDARAQDEFEVVISVESDSGGGAVAFAGTQGTYVQKRMTLAELNVELQDLFFIFRDVNWYGTTGVSISVSDLGNRGWNINRYSDMYHEDISPQSVALKGGTMTIVPEDTLWHHSLFAQDFTWELYGKVMSSFDDIRPTTFGTTPPPPTFQPYDLESAFDGLLFRNDYLGDNISAGVDDPSWGAENASDRPLCSFSIGSDGRLKFTLLSEEGRLQGTGRALLEEGTWYHLALIVRRRSRDVDIPPAESEADTTLGEVAIYVDKKLDAAYRWRAPQRFVGPTRRSALQVSVGKSAGLVLSRARLWPRALEAGDLAQCAEPLGSVAGGPEGLGDARPRETLRPFPHLVGAEALDSPALSFSFGGSLAEASRRAHVLSTGSWSFVADSPPACLGLTQAPYDNFFEYCVAYDHAFSRNMGEGNTGEPYYFWQSPQAYQSLDMQLYASAGVKSVEAGELTAGTFLSVHRSFVNEPPRIVMLEPRSGLLHVFEDHANFMSFMVKHKAAENLVDRDLTVFLSTSHGRVRTISSAAIPKSSLDGKRVEFTAKLHELNAFLSQLQYLPDPNYNGPDLMDMLVTDGEFSVNTSVQVEIETMSDPITIVCPPAVDLFEGQMEVPIGTNISIRDHEPIPGFDDESSRVGVEIFAGDGGLDLLLEAVPHLAADLREALDEVRNDTYDAQAADDSNRSSPGVPAFVFNTTLAGFRAALRALVFTPFPELYHGVVHLEVRVIALETEEETRCEIGLIVHPVNSAPEIAVDESRLLSATNGGLVKPHKDIHLHGVIRLSDPDEENFSGGWFVQRVHSARLKLRASCGTLSFLMAGPQDYVLGVQNGSIAGTEGITFHSGDGAHDTDMDVTSTLRNLNLQLSRLFYHSGGDCRGENITIAVELDDLGNYGAYKDEMGNYGHPHPIVVTNEVYFQVLEF